MANSPSFKELKEIYFLLDLNFNKLFAACTTEEQRDRLRVSYVTARDNFFEAQNRVFQQNDPLVKKLTQDVKDAKEQISGMLSNLKQIVKVLDAVTAAVHLGSSLITLGSALL
ncbi:MAG: hypothetical protein JOZ96_28565 [Acidobacteria bacterium]|nr:hypothetical protein [Acidobacteriota bacterium]